MKGDYTEPVAGEEAKRDEGHPQMKGDYTSSVAFVSSRRDEGHPQMKGDYTHHDHRLQPVRTKTTPK